MELTKEYLYCYSKLADPEQSKKANRRLLELEQSQEAWALAQDLINHANSVHHVHGYQLLSRKLNKAPPQEISMQGIISFIYSKNKKTSLHWVCIAKAVLHLNSKDTLNLSELQKSDMIKLVKEMPSAISQVRTNPPLDSMEIKRKYLQIIMPILLESFDSNTSQILECITVFLEEGIKLKNSQMMKKILSQEIEVVGSLLDDILSKEIYKQLQVQIVQFFDKNRTSRMLPSIVMAFYRNIDLNDITVQRFAYQIQYLLACLLIQQQQKQTYLLCNSYDFWQQLFSNLNQSRKITPQKQNIILSALCSLWNIICTSCKFQELPSTFNVNKSSLSLDVDELSCQNQENGNENVIEGNVKANRFRDYAEDYMALCFKCIVKQPQIINLIFSYLYQLTKSSLLELELSIFIISNILQTQTSLLNHLKPSIKLIFTRKQQYSEYLCSKVINLIGKIQNLIQLDPSILQQALSFLLTCINYDRLSNIASENCCQLLQAMKDDEGQLHNDNHYGQNNNEELQKFVNQLYHILFANNNVSQQSSSFSDGVIKEKVCQNLTKSITIYIYKYKKDATTYQNYLQYYSSQLSSFAYNHQKRRKYLQAVIMAQFWLNTKDQQKYLMIFSKFLDQQIEFLMSLVSQSKTKPQLSEAIYMINIAIKTNAILVIQKWLQMIDHIFSSYLHHNPIHIIFTPLKNIINASIHLQSISIMQKVFTFTYKWIQPLTLILVNQQKHQFSLTGILIQIHLIIIKTYKSNQSLASLQQNAIFSIKNMINYLINYIHSTQLYEYQVFKFSLQYYTIALELGIEPEPIVSNVLCNYQKLADTLWKYVETILFFTYKKYGAGPILSGLKDAKSSLNQENPLTQILMLSLQKNEGKTVKNILLSLG